ncbi:bifunctional helix-turn-helix transcriptional regulator/GNAT family N-acetyltransferase [Algicella marina]|uniref:GNAT family N-acetyltransferase n=1 Tax=Algicella marina TaxID=2683284 RepID=A0A6P1STQ4_9RHOB|nr:bifunctional helix-turn-helix transcriptional regulator/GNAT family N-acetyltransferase [Algicella marina]QHQ34064.1 GNAT family N-acetyltransferase [Algicella marina]
MNEPDSTVATVRSFNRFYTTLVGALGESLLASGLALPQLRVFYEIASASESEPPAASDIATHLNMDAGYLSRILSTLEAKGLVNRTPSPGNAKRLALTPTGAGSILFMQVDKASAAEIEALISPLSAPQRRELTDAMATIRRLLGPPTQPAAFVLRDPVPGDLALITAAQAQLYAQEYGFDWHFEALVARITAEFIDGFDPRRERCWVAEREGQIIGSVFVVQQDEHTAKLRLLYVDPSARGLGLGRRLVGECLRFARTAGYGHMTLWTNKNLTAARHIYQSAGFELISEESHRSFGKDLVGQYWGRDL